MRLRRDAGILWIEIDRPGSDLNTVNGTLHGELTELFGHLRVESEAGAIVLTGSGRAFTAGGDFEWLRSMTEPTQLYELHKHAKQLIWDLVDIEIPIVAAVNGPAVGLGASIALLCDVVVMAEDAVLADPHVRVGIVAGDGGAAIWPLLVGPMRAKQFLMLGDSVSASEAHQLGLVSSVVSADQVTVKAREMALRLAGMPRHAVRYTKLSVNKLVKDALNTAFDTSTALEMLTFLDPARHEILDALVRRRAHG